MKRKIEPRIKKSGTKTLKAILCASVLLFTMSLTAYLFSLGGAESLTRILKNGNYWRAVMVENGFIAVGYLLMTSVDAQKIALEENELEDTQWLTEKRLKKLREFSVFDYADAAEQTDGIVIGADAHITKKKQKIKIVTTNQLHALVVGTTGSGKTTGFVDQNIAFLGKSAGKPSLVIADPKQELYEKHAATLKSEGYKICVLNLREPYISAKWNPMEVLIRRIRKVKDLEYNFYEKDGKYYGAGECFLMYAAAQSRMQELKDEIYENAQDLVYTLCPIRNKDQQNWESGARNFIFGFILAMCEDCIKGKIEEKQMVLFNVYHNITKYCTEDTAELRKYLLDGRSEFSKVRSLVNTVLITSEKTLTSYLSEVNAYMQQLSDEGIMAMASESEITASETDEAPTAIFIVVPDERYTRHSFVTLFITQLYKEMVEKANANFRSGKTGEARLKRNAYFILDEFGNLPKMENLDGMVTVARSRGIRFLFVLQSFAQLAAKYGKEIAEVVKSNCNVKMFVGSDDPETRKEFSELCGMKKIKHVSVNTSAESNASSTSGANTRALITPGMLERLNGNEKGDAVVSVRGYEPIFSHFTPSYKLAANYFPCGKAQEVRREAENFDKEKYVFDIAGKTVKEDTENKIELLEEAETSEKNNEKSAAEEKAREYEEEIKKLTEQTRKETKGISAYLSSGDLAAFKAMKADSRSEFLRACVKNYPITLAGKLENAAKNIAENFEQMRNLQKKLKNIKEGEEIEKEP